MHVLQIIFVISEENKLLFPTYHTWKMSPHYLVKCTTFSSHWTHWRYVAFLQTLAALKRTGCDVWQMECQASNVTANVQSDHLLHGYMLPVFFATDQLHRPPRSAKVQPMLQRFRNSSVSRICNQYAWKNKKMENLCILHGSAVTFFRCGG